MSHHIGETNKMISKTPRTDAAWKTLHTIYELAGEMKRMERELNAANKRIKRLEKDSERLQWLLDRGLAWRDCYDEHWIKGEWLYASQDAIETIDKAKEAKP